MTSVVQLTEAKAVSRSKLAEILASWYLRFNGFFCLENFILHDAGSTRPPGAQFGEADIVAVRPPHTREFIEARVETIEVRLDPRLGLRRDLFECIIAEVSSYECKLNWLDARSRISRRELEYALRRIGLWTDEQVTDASDRLAEQFVYLAPESSLPTRVRLFAFGKANSASLPTGVEQRTFAQVLEHMGGLFGCYDPLRPAEKRPVVSDNKQWNPVIREVYRHLRGHKCDAVTPQELADSLFP